MNKKITVTPLINEGKPPVRTYYYSQDENGKVMYCDALIPEEASCKYMLATSKVDNLIIIGSNQVIKPSDETGPLPLRDGKLLFSSVPKSLSTYSFLRYRLAEYAGEKQADHAGDDMTPSDKEKSDIVAFLHNFFEEHLEKDSDIRLNRYFHLLAQDHDLRKEFDEALGAWTQEPVFEKYRAWAFYYLYRKLKDSYKMEMLEANADVQIRLISVDGDDSSSFTKAMMKVLYGGNPSNPEDCYDLFLCIQNIDAHLALNIFNLINLSNILPDDTLQICKTISASREADVLANKMLDTTRLHNITKLLSGVEAFLKYGKTNIIVEYWEKTGIDNPDIEKIIYAMRNIDTGISLCDISEIERGIKSMREMIAGGKTLEGNTPLHQALNIALEGTRRDYGKLLESDHIEFIELVKWAYRKEFWQQTLTLIESRAPRDFVAKGFYYYCDSEEEKDKVTKIFGQLYWDLKSYEKYKMDDLDHYYVKFYNRSKASNQKHGKEYMQNYAKVRTEELDSQSKDEIRACTACPDRSALEELLFAYYYVGDTRNETNHASDTFNGFSEIMKDSDSGERMETIRQCVDYFLHCYDKVNALVEGREANIIQITNDELMDYVNELRSQNRKNSKKV